MSDHLRSKARICLAAAGLGVCMAKQEWFVHIHIHSISLTFVLAQVLVQPDMLFLGG